MPLAGTRQPGILFQTRLSGMFLLGTAAPLKVIPMQLIAPDRNFAPFPGRVYNFIERSIAAPICNPIPGRPVPDDHNRLLIEKSQHIVTHS